MGQNTNVVKEKFNKTFTVPVTSGNYASEKITFGVVPSGVQEDSGIGGITALIESAPAGASLELWLPKLGASNLSSDYFYSGVSITSGMFTVPLAAYPGAQLRCKSGGTSGNMIVDATSLQGATGLVAPTAADTVATLTAGELHLGSVGGQELQSTAEFTRPSDTTAYTAGDIVSNSTTASTMMQFTLARVAGGSGIITSVRLMTDKKTETAAYRLHLYNVSEGTATVAVDNAQNTLLYANRTFRIGHVDLIAMVSGADTTNSTGSRTALYPVNLPFVCANGDTKIYGLLENLTGTTPASGQKFSCTITADVN